MSEYRVFISHKDEDHATALAVQTALQQFSGDLRCFISGEKIVEGEDWHARLRSELKDSDLLLLLFTEPTKKWDWCLYEVGLFEQLESDRTEPVVCIHSPESEPPGPLASLEGVSANPSDMFQFVSRLIKTTDITKRERPLNENVSDEQIQESADRICDEFAGNIHPYYACHRVYLDLPAELPTFDEIPLDATVTASEGTMRVFGRLPGPMTWGDLIEDHRGSQDRWIDEINRVFKDACSGRVSAMTTHTFRAHDGARIFRPELYRLDTRANAPVSAVVMLTEEVAPAKVGGPVFNRLRSCERYQAEVFDRLHAASVPISDEVRSKLTEAFDLIREEDQTHKVFADESLRTNFTDKGMQDELREVSDRWLQEVETYDAATAAGDSEEIAAVLGRLEKLNREYWVTVGRRYLELLEQQAG